MCLMWKFFHVMHVLSIKDYLSRNNNSRTQILPHTAAVPHWPVGNLPLKQISAWYGQILTPPPTHTHTHTHTPTPTPTPDIGIELYMVKYYTARPPRWFSLFDVLHVPHSTVKCIHSSVAGWEYHTRCIYQKRIICPEITQQVPLTWFSMFNVPYRPIQLPFLSGRLGIMDDPHWPVGSITHTAYIKRRLLLALSPHTAAVPQWPVGSNGHSSLAGWESPL